MIMKSSTTLGDKCNEISDIAKETGQPIYITKEDKVDSVLMSIDAYKTKIDLLQFKEKMLIANQQRLIGDYVSMDEAFAKLRAGL